jgi:hypothetical protein
VKPIHSKQVLRVDFGEAPDGDPLMASSGGNTCLIWNFGGAGPSGSAPIITLGHTKPVQCQVGAVHLRLLGPFRRPQLCSSRERSRLHSWLQ